MNYKQETNRYRYYYRRLERFYHTQPVQVSTAVLFTIGTIIFFAVFAIRPTLQTIAELLKKIDDQREVLNQAERKTTMLATAQEQYNNAEKYLPALDMAIPADYETQSLLKYIEAAAAELQIPISSIQIDGIKNPIPKKAVGIQEISFNLTLDVPYPQLKLFINRLQQLPRVITITNITMNSDVEKKKSPTTTNTNVSTSLACKTYFVSTKESNNETSR